MKNTIEIQDHGVMVSDYFQGTIGVWLNISLDRNTTVKEIIELLEQDINEVWDHIEFMAEMNSFKGDLKQAIDQEVEKIKKENKDKMDEIHKPDLDFSFEDAEEDSELPVLILTIEFKEE